VKKEEQDGGDEERRCNEQISLMVNFILHSVNQILFPKCSMPQAFPRLHLPILLHNELVTVVIRVFTALPSSCEEVCTCWIHELSWFLSKLDKVLDIFCLPCVEDIHGMSAILEQR
jgi:hypothetical protein